MFSHEAFNRDVRTLSGNRGKIPPAHHRRLRLPRLQQGQAAHRRRQAALRTRREIESCQKIGNREWTRINANSYPRISRSFANLNRLEKIRGNSRNSRIHFFIRVRADSSVVKTAWDFFLNSKPASPRR